MRKKNKLYDIKRPIHLYDGLTEATQNIDVSGHGILGDPTKIDIGAISSMKTPKIGGGIGVGMGDLASGIGTAVGKIGGSLIGGGLQSGAGSAISNLGGAAAGIVGKFNPMAGAIVGAASGVLGGLTNRFFGSKLNEENIANLKQNINKTQNVNFGGSYDDINNQYLQSSSIGAFDDSYIGKDGVFSHKAKNLANELRLQSQAVNDYQADKYTNAINTTNQENFNNSMYNVAAFGGELNNYNNFFTEINNGGTHEQNPNHGVQIGNDSNGIPNLVEQGETIYNDYVYSNRLKLPKDIQKKYNLENLTFAEASKKFAKSIKEMPNDSIARRTLDIKLNELKDSQEELKAKKERAKQLRQFNKLSPDEKLGLMQMAQNNVAPIGDENNIQNLSYSTQDINQQELPQDITTQDINQSQSYAYGGNIYDGLQMPNQFLNLNKPLHLNYNFNPINYLNDYLHTPELTWTTPSNIPFLRKSLYGFNYTPANLEGNIPADKTLTKEQIDKIRTKPTYDLFTMQRMAYPHNSYFNRLSDLTGKSVEDLKENYPKYRQGLFGWVSETPNLQNEYALEAYKNIKNNEPSLANPIKFLNEYNLQPINDTPIGANINESNINESNINNTNKVNTKEQNSLYPTWMRYAPIVGSAIGLGTSLFSKPDESSANAVLNAGREASKFIPVSFNPIGDYIRYNPFDRDYYINMLNAQSGATRRNILNTSNGNRGTMIAGLLSADNNAQNQLGQLARQAEEYNDAQRMKVAEFNRGTNQYNSEGLFKASMANQSAFMNNKNTFLNATMQAERLRQAARQQLAAERSANFTNLFNNIGNLGRENMNFNILNSSPAYTWNMSKDGQQYYNSLMNKNKKSCGGKLNKKGGKR